MSKNIASIVTANGILLFINNTPLAVGNDHPNFGKIKTALAAKNYDAIPALADIVTSVRNWLNNGNDFELRGDQVYLNGTPFSAAVTSKVLDMINAGANAEPLYAFLRKVRTNPSKTSQDELLLFCVANGFMIHEDGDILAYKSVRGDYTDIHSGKFNNSVGKVVVMERGAVDDNRDRTCSTGLHFASHEYASTWAGAIDGKSRRLMVMKINPRDVVSIPSDYNNQKGRCARYEVIAELAGGNRLPKQEVYTTRCVGGVCQADVIRARDEAARKAALDQRAQVAARIASERTKIEAEIARKRAVARGWEDQLVDLNDRVDTIVNLGGDATALEDEIERLESKVERIEGEVRVCQRKLAAV